MDTIDMTPTQQIALLRILHETLEQSGWEWFETTGEYIETGEFHHLSRDPAEWLANMLGVAATWLDAQPQAEASGAGSVSEERRRELDAQLGYENLDW